MRPDSHTRLPNNRLYSLSFCFFEDDVFFGVFCTITLPFPHCMESALYVFLPDCVEMIAFFYLVTTGFIFNIAYYVRIQPINQSIIRWYFQRAHFIPLVGVRKRGVY